MVKIRVRVLWVVMVVRVVRVVGVVGVIRVAGVVGVVRVYWVVKVVRVRVTLSEILKWQQFLKVIYRFLKVIYWFLKVILTRGRYRAARAAKKKPNGSSAKISN